MRYQDAIQSLYRLEPRGISLGLGRVERALSQRGNPERALSFVSIAGTNGKGSVAAMMASVLKASGLRVGLYTSPHLHRLVERFCVNGRAMPMAELARRVAVLQPWLAHKDTPQLTFFEVCTVLALEFFRDEGCDIALLEVGLGGRLDATNVVTPRLSVITRVALDHQDRLGPTLRHIAREKAGIIKAGVPVVTGEREGEPLSVIETRARRLGAPLYRIDREFSAAALGPRFEARFQDRLFTGLTLPLLGDHQADNLACAIAGLSVLADQGLPMSEGALKKGLSRVRWPGRLELLPGKPAVLCDAAHNPDACAVLARHVAGASGYGRKVLLFGVLKDKDHVAMLSLLLPVFDEVVFATPESTRARGASELSARFGGSAFEDVPQALRYAQRRGGTRGLVVASGSIVLMSVVRALVLGVREDPKIAL